MSRLNAMVFVSLLVLAGAARGAPLHLTLTPDPGNPVTPTMGDHMGFHGVIANTGDRPIEGVVAWISLVEVDPGHEQPVDLEDWSAHKAVAGASLAPGGKLETDWPMRLINNGDYRVVISVTDRDRNSVYTSPAVQFHVARKPVVESGRIVPVAVGVPLLIGGVLGYRLWANRRRTPA